MDECIYDISGNNSERVEVDWYEQVEVVAHEQVEGSLRTSSGQMKSGTN